MVKVIRLSEVLGWYGVVAVIAAYSLNAFNIINPHQLSYLLLNLTGSLGIMWDAWNQKNYQPVVLNVVWGLIALIGLIQLIFR